MKFWHQLICALLLVALSSSTSAKTHELVQAALDWQLPLNKCSKPRTIISHRRVVAAGGTYFQAPSTATRRGAGTATISDIDHYQINRFERKKKRWEACVRNYKSALLEHFETLKNSATYGLTKEQAEIILGKLAQLQAAVESPDGITTVDNPLSTSTQSGPGP